MAPRPVSRIPRVLPPTLATAGAKTCTAGEPIVLGPHGEGDAVLGFDPTGGLVAWKRDKGVLAVQALGLDGKPIGPGATVDVAEGIEPKRVFALGDSFVVLLQRWDWQTPDLAWWGVVVGRDGRTARPPVDLGLRHFAIHVAQVTGDHAIALVVGAAAYTKNATDPARWQTLATAASGVLTSTSASLGQRDLGGEWIEADLDGARGWIVVRDGRRDADGFFDGARKPAAGAIALQPDNALDVHVTNAARPPPSPRGPNVTIIEPMGRPMLERERLGQPVGEPLALERDGNPIAHGMHISTDLAWSGTHFIYPFWDDDGGPTHDKYVVRLLAIDCR